VPTKPNIPADLLSPDILALNPYVVLPAEGSIKLDAMENPWPWPGQLEAEWLESLRGIELNRYPDPEARELAAALRQWLHLPDDLGLLLGNGSDELLQIILMAVAGSGRPVLTPGPTFVMYRMISKWLGLNCIEVPLTADFDLDQAAMLAAIKAEQPAVVFLAWPNNPTGKAWPREAIIDIVENTSGLVVVDEAYSAFADDSVIDLLGRYPNLLLLRTFSKIGLAGLRLGYLAGPRLWLTELNKLRMPYNVGQLTQVSAQLALRHDGLLAAQATRLRNERRQILLVLEALEGVSPIPSNANFILFRLTAENADDEPVASRIHAELRAEGLLIKNLHGSHPALENCLRVTVGSPRENRKFLAALKRLL